ncbi:YgaP-like transmembrane domain [Bacillus sp. FJAT-22090]|uniref:YgaP-like transmembrane domain n=1 Tax=Bacillus sp. FJAT-22090 TaxID=1581038 RepID=UPI0006AED5A7|nr:YgaP-like transmembrane domain [Bacillus sp. FJAT-22090]
MTNKPQQNIGSKSAFTRFMMGSVMTAYGTAQLMRNPKSRSGQMLIMFGAMTAAEGATKYCPSKAVGSTMLNSNMIQKMMNKNASQSTLAGVGATSGSQSLQSSTSGTITQASGNIMQMIGNIAQKLTSGNAAQNNKAGTQNMSSGNQQNGQSGNIAQTIGNAAQQMTSGTAAQTIGNIAQTVAPQVGQMMSSAASMTGTQNPAGTNNVKKQASATGGASKTNGIATNGTSNVQKNASAKSTNSNNKQATSSNGNNNQNTNATKPLLDGAANKDVAASSVINASNSTDKNTTTSNILQ